jgi:Bifunctional DNA primase/polymerase, N-terminal
VNMLRAAALRYTARGLPVLPLHTPAANACSCGRPGCDSPGKHPRTLHGLHDAATDPDTVCEWWRRWPDANVGLRTGTSGGLVALDVDGRAAADALAELRGERELGGLLIRTGRGWQLWYATPTETTVRTGAGTLAPGVDVRGACGYVVAPPSLHASGRRYQVLRGTLGPMPGWLLSALEQSSPTRPVTVPASAPNALRAPRHLGGDATRRQLLRDLRAAETFHEAFAPVERRLLRSPTGYGRRVLDTACEKVRTAREGERHTVLNKSAFIIGGYLTATGLKRDEVVAALKAAAEAAGLESEADQAQTERTIDRGLDAGAERPRSIPGAAP